MVQGQSASRRMEIESHLGRMKNSISRTERNVSHAVITTKSGKSTVLLSLPYKCSHLLSSLTGRFSGSILFGVGKFPHKIKYNNRIISPVLFLGTGERPKVPMPKAYLR